MFRNRSVDIARFSMVPRADIPRASFTTEAGYKTTFDADYLIPFYLDEVLPGDSFKVDVTAMVRLATPIVPVMDNMYLETFFFFVPERILWTNFKRFMGERYPDVDSTIDFVMPETESPVGGYAANSLQDYMGLPTVGQVEAASQVTHRVSWLRAYNMIWNEWFRDQNHQDAVVVDLDDGPDDPADYVLLKRGKRFDYFTGSLPEPQKGDSVSIPLGTEAPVFGIGVANNVTFPNTNAGIKDASGEPPTNTTNWSGAVSDVYVHGVGAGDVLPRIYADLSEATAATINQLRQAFQIQKLLERDMRGGTRYTELTRAHFGVVSPDARLQRPEYLGGGSIPISVKPVEQTSGTSASGTTTPLGNLAGIGLAVARGHGFSQSFTEHGVIVGLMMVRGDITYQQGLRRMWSRSTRYDFYFPAFAMLGEQAVLKKEIFCDGQAGDEEVWGYQERWAELRHHPSMITGLFRSTTAGAIDVWHLAEEFATRPSLGPDFIESNTPVDRIVAVGSGANGKQFLFDSVIRKRMVRPMPLFSVPGLIDHF